MAILLVWVGGVAAVFLALSVLAFGVPLDKGPSVALLLVVISASGWLYLRHTGDDAQVTHTVIFKFLISIALPVLAFLGAPLLVLSQFYDIEIRLWQAIIAGLVIATGWLTSAVFSELERKRAKAEKLRDYHKALYAEIGYTLQTLLDRGEAETEAARIVAQMRGSKKFIPFIPREHHDFLYDSLVGEIEVLPRVTIDAIVAYYSQIKSMTALADDMRGEAFRSPGMQQERRILMYQDYFEMRKNAFAMGQHALRLIKEYAEKGPAAAEALAARINSQAAAPSDLSQGSE
ncbi:hypothetical protein RKLH11_2306 [Rhodobacteraceae bacterium KLH11]|nr:hypothetical protein RKLH11_2306 [Rhodobacteraceae bacterium KLH11]